MNRNQNQKKFLLPFVAGLTVLLFLNWFQISFGKTESDSNKNSNNSNSNSNSNSNANSNINSNANTNSNINANSNINSNTNNNQNISPAELAKRQQDLKKKQDQLNSVQKQINNFQEKTDILDQRTDTIQDMISRLDEDIKFAEAAVQKTEEDLAEVEGKLNDKNHEITLKEDDIDKRKIFLEEYMRKLNLLDKKSILEVMLEKNSLTDYFQEAENIVAFEQRLQELLAELNTERKGLLTEKEEIEEAKIERLSLFSMRESQRAELDKDKKDREDLLAETKGEQTRIQDLINKGSQVASRLSTEITALQSCGTKIDFGQALDDAKAVSQLTGVRAAFLLGVLKIESNMGNNVGGGTYKNDMNPAQWDRFKSICTQLGYNPNDRPVSRKPCYRDSSGNCGGWGGAMGPAQFMPSTWMGYKDQVAQVTGHNPPDPWNLRDALTAMGLKLAKVDGVTRHERSAEHKAASIYLAGGNWARFSWYGDRVMKFADSYKDQIN